MINTVVDFSPVLNSILAAVGAVVLALTGVLINSGRAYLDKKFHLADSALEDDIQQRFNEAAKRSMAYAVQHAGTALQRSGDGKIDVGSQTVAEAANYLIEGWPGLVEKAGLTPAKVMQAIEARLPSQFATDADTLALAKAGPTAPVATVIVAAPVPMGSQDAGGQR